MKPSTRHSLSDDQLKQLTRRSDARGLIQLSAHLLLLLFAGIAMANVQGLLFLVSMLAYGALLTFLFAPLHESIHFTAFKTAGMNNLVAAFTGFLLLIPFRYFRAFHYAHHRHTQNAELDPELLSRKPLNKSGYWRQVSGLDFWLGNAKLIYQHALGEVKESFIEPSKHRKIIFEARVHLLLYLLLLVFSFLVSSSFIWWYWILPALLTQPLLRLFLLAEHSGCDMCDDMLQNSRTTYTSPVVSFLCWNMCYHAEHHSLASVPFHALPALHAYTGQQVKHKGDGYYQVNREIASGL